MKQKLLSFFLGVFFMLYPVSYADQNNPNLNILFEQLLNAQNSEQSYIISQQIYQIWFQGPDAESTEQIRLVLKLTQEANYTAALAKNINLIESYPDFSEGWHRLAVLYYLLQLYPQALESLEKTLELEPRHILAYQGAALVFNAIGKLELAKAMQEHVLKLDPYNILSNKSLEELENQLGLKT